MVLSNIDRCLLILEILTEHKMGLPLREIALKADMPKSAAHRTLDALGDAGYVTQLPSRNYGLTFKLPGLGFRFLSSTGIPEQCQFILDRLAEQFGELVRLAVINNDQAVWVAKAQGARSGLIVDPVMGRRPALHASAAGKAWLASLSTEDALRFALRDGFGTPQEYGPAVIQSVEALQAELIKTKRRGYGLELEEADQGVASIAVGITNGVASDSVVAALSATGPSTRLSKDRLLRLLPRLQAAADRLKRIDALVEFTNSFTPPSYSPPLTKQWPGPAATSVSHDSGL